MGTAVGYRGPRGHLVDYLTQLWVRTTGRAIADDEHDWLRGPVGAPNGIGPEYFQAFSVGKGWSTHDGHGILPDTRSLDCSGNALDAEVRAFYEHTADYNMDVWSEWTAALRPFGWLIIRIFGRRLDQLNVPLSPLEMRDGLTSRVIDVLDPHGTLRYVAWLRTTRSTGRVLYAGTYSLCTVPGYQGYCIKVEFPLPNGSATVILRPQVDTSGSLHLYSEGHRFGDPGFYFVVEHGERRWARYVRAMREHIHVYQKNGMLVTDHTLRIFGVTFLRLHYRMSRRSNG